MPDLLFELRCEELPPRDLAEAARSLMDGLGAALAASGLEPRTTSAAWTPRRIAVWAHGLAERTADREERLAGPKLAAAFDASGAPTKAAEGFARKAGVAIGELQRDAACVFAMKRTPGRAAAEIVAEILPTLPVKTKWKKTMRWGGPVEFARPIRGVVAILGGDVVACTVAGLAAGRVTRGHPFLAPVEVRIDSASRDEYLAKLRSVFVLADFDERRAAVLASAKRLVQGLAMRESLLEEVTNLVEWPTALLGRIDERFQRLPPTLLITVMEHHQRFFPLREREPIGFGEPIIATTGFVAVLDREPDSIETSRRGFERVLNPRLHDASFFVAEDRKSTLASRLPRLVDVTYHRKLGTLQDKARRLERLAAGVSVQLGHSTDDQRLAARAGVLAKCDLVTLLVGEFPELQGYVGMLYAIADGEEDGVSQAVGAQYRRDFSTGRPLSEFAPALALVLAENLDVLCQFGTKVSLPTGSTDPFGVRRAAITLLDACERFAPEFDLVAAVRHAGGDAAVLAYLDTRLRQRLRDEGFRHDHLDAVTSWTSVGGFRERVEDLSSLAGAAGFNLLLEVAERCRNITKRAENVPAAFSRDLATEPAEVALLEAWSALRHDLPTPPAPLSRSDVSTIALGLAKPLHRFFADVLVNAPDPAIRGNRLALLRDIDVTLLRFADLCRIQKA